MKIDHCDHCRQLVFFENSKCLSCGHALAFFPDAREIGSLDEAGDGLWRRPTGLAKTYRLCANYRDHNVCNWAVSADDPNPLCLSCRLTRVIPDLTVNGARDLWFRTETAKRRLLYTLIELELPILTKTEDPERGLVFELLADPVEPDAPPVLTGHDGGVITINIVEADDAEREKRRVALHEPYRTMLGHLRHEIGHFYWDRLIDLRPRLEKFRELFGDERADYGEALARHYKDGPPSDWSTSFISTYATAHPWEDWAESWAHYLHMVDALETAAAWGLALHPKRLDEPSLNPQEPSRTRSFDNMIADWFPLTFVLNSLNRGLGLADGYPFVLSTPVIEKLRFIHDTIRSPHADEPMSAAQPNAPREAVANVLQSV